MSLKDLEARRAYQRARYHAKNGAKWMREWRAVNPGKAKAIYERAQEKLDLEEQAQRMREWRAANPEKVEADKKKRREASARRKTKRPAPITALETAIYQRQYAKHASNNFPEKKTAARAKRRASELRATPEWADRKAMQAVYEEAAFRKEIVGGEWHVDHIVPLRSKLVCGLHNQFNLQVLPGEENLAKSNKFWPDMP